jgi:uncharacterized membrane protein (Fun14 family)
MRSQQVTLGPLFPRFAAVLIGVLMVMVAWVLPFALAAERAGRIEAFCFGLLVLTVLFVPRYGTVTVNPDERFLTFRESVAAAFLHPWRGRELRKVSLPEGSTILIGWWLAENAFATGGIKRIAADGDSTLLFENKFGFDGAIASRLASAVRSVAGINVRTVRLGAAFEVVDWSPTDAPAKPNGRFLFYLSWAGFALAMLHASATAIFVAGIACFAVYAIVTHTRLRKARMTQAEVDRFGGTTVFWFGLFQFTLMYAVMAMLGSTMR